jgi:hypothetical protein
MRFSRCLAPALAVLLLFTAGSKKPSLTVRFYMEAAAGDTDHFAEPVQLKYPPRSAYISKAPFISEHNIRGIYLFPKADGTYGCLFKLDEDGRLGLEAASMEHRGGSVVAFVGTKTGTHQVIDMIIDKRVSDGVISIQQGLTPPEVEELRKQFHPIVPGEKKR